jgi:ParB family chromosome partitioning protein
MANKNLVKRAFSVTANLPAARPAVAPETTDAAIQEFPQNGVVAPADTVSPQPRLVPTPRTSPGSMLAFMAEQSEVHKEVIQLRERLEVFEGSEVTKRLDPKTITASKWANRDRAHFSTQAFKNLKAEIESAGGNIQPIKVRVISGSIQQGTARYEIVYGHRRHQACLELGILVLALIDTSMLDAQLFIEMDRENREREDLSPWEQGVMYTRALDEGLFPSAKQLASAIGVDMGTVSKAKTLSSLPKEVVAAFGSPLDLQFRWGKLLTEALQRDPEGVLERARLIASQESRPMATEVLKTLIQTPGTGKSRSAGAAEWLNEQGARVATLSSDRKGKTMLVVESLDEGQQRRLAKLLDSFFGLKRE